jgi:UDP-N-acetylmuramoyl-tripeptide--D-alanyl-D-alanine ligase
MIQRTLREIADMAGASLQNEDCLDVVAAGVTTDSRSVSPRQLFIPIVGARVDGHDYVLRALKQGAAAALWQRDHSVPAELAAAPLLFIDDSVQALQRLAAAYRSQLPVRVVGITGSNGKTTTKDLTASVLAGRYNLKKTQGNHNNEIGLPLTLLDLDEDTEVSILEMGMSDFGEIALLTKLAQPEIALITNVGDSHLLQLGSREGIAQAKLEITTGLRAGGVLLYNGDETLLQEGLQGLTLPAGVHTMTFGLGTDNDWYARNIELLGGATAFDVWHQGVAVERRVVIPLLGKHNVTNALAAIAVARLYDVTWEQIRTGLAQVALTGMRIQSMQTNIGARLLNDAYNASPTSVRAAIDVLAHMKGYRKKWIVLGDMLELGTGELAYHEQIGKELLPAEIDYVVTYGSLARGIAAGARNNFGSHAIDEVGDPRVVSFMDKHEAGLWLRERVQAEDILLVKGSRGMFMEEIIQELM